MAKEENLYVPFFADDTEAMSELDDAECGRLFLACLRYAETGEAPKLDGNERFLFPMFRGRIDRFLANKKEREETYRANANKRKQIKAIDSNSEQTEQLLSIASNCSHTETETDTETNTDTETETEAKSETKAKSNPQKRAGAREGNEAQEPPKTAFTLFDELAPEYGLSVTLAEKMREWLRYKKERRESYKAQGLKTLVSMAKKNADEYGDKRVCELIDASMANGYQGITWDKLKQTPPVRGAPVETSNPFLQRLKEQRYDGTRN